jgi:NAD(P)-dependent dehydrogenase (short-subunit alcohol dehydrogenase family)
VTGDTGTVPSRPGPEEAGPAGARPGPEEVGPAASGAARPGARAGLAALLIGLALGGAAAAGTALLLYTGHGFLRAAGLLVSSTIMAVAAGLWAGAPDAQETQPPASRGRWIALIFAMLIGGGFTALWALRPAVRDAAAGGALAVLLVLALPAYAAGALIASVHAREQAAGRHRAAGAGAAAVAGAALGVLLATTFLIQTFEPYGIYYGAAGVLILAALIESAPASAAYHTEPDMRGQVVLITGVGDRGQLGYAVADRFLAAGARVVITDVSPQVAELAAELAGSHAGEDVRAVQADLLADDQVAGVIDAVRAHGVGLHALINVAGGLGVSGDLMDTSPDAWRREVQRNAETVLRMCRAALPLLRESGGAIVNFASPAGLRAAAGLGAYSAAKAAVIALTRALALEELEHGVRVNALAPGMIDTAQNRRDAEADTVFVARDDVASVALFLAGPAARGVSGETIQVLGPTLS